MNISESIAKNEYIKELSNTQIRIQPKTSIRYTLIVKELLARNTNFYTYKIKEERSFKVALKTVTSI